ncbi:hypothetical protein EIP91_005879 [Steccherinum ochraceum]|uniref:DUF6534 domain-containing protein n=1 Tax=Steccherinum ochraceum TaxID=92696 RepID=A0A4R0R6V6_9APHY|nr:hypothetical protein EIP91_005879 [Steccherinum ochraceum]
MDGVNGGQIAQIAHGPSLVGIFMNVMLYGVMLMQCINYWTFYQRDPKWMKSYVGFLLLADTLNTAFNMAWIYNVLINNFGNIAALETADWLFETEESMAGIIAMSVQLFYAWRIWVLLRNPFLVTTVIATSLLAGRIGTSIAVAMRPNFSQFQSLKVIVVLWLVGSAVCDILITTTLLLHLRKSRTGFSLTDTALSKITRLTVSNGLITSAFALADVVAYLSTPKGIHIAFNYTLVKLYTNSVMSTLNSRATGDRSHYSSSGGHKRSVRDPQVSNFVSTDISLRPQVVVNVETHEMTDFSQGSSGKSKMDPEWADGTQMDSKSSKNSTINIVAN